MSGSLDGLRVVDLKAELEKRGLDKSGNKQVLLERLQKAIDEAKEGQGETKSEKQEETDDNSTSGAEIKDESLDMSGDVLDLNSTLEIKKEEKMDDSVEEVKIIDNAPQEEDASVADAKKAKQGDDATEQQQQKEEEVDISEVELAAKAKVTLHAESLEAKYEVVNADAELKPDAEDVVEDIDGDVDMKPDEVQNGQEDSSSSTTTTTTTTAATTAATTGKTNGSTAGRDAEKKSTSAEVKDVKKEPKNGKKDDGEVTSSTSPSKIKERLTNDQNRNLWITNISQTTRATELKQALSEHGKVVGAKVVINARHPAACCYGYVRMETVADADNCIAKLNNTELNGQIIRIEKVRPDHLNPNSKGKDASKDGKERPPTKTPVRAPTPAPAKDKDEAAAKKERKPVEAPPKDEGRSKEKAKTLSAAEEKKTSGAASAKDKDVKDGKEKEAAKVVAKERSRDKERRRTRSRSREGKVRSLSSTAPPPARAVPPAPPPRRGEVPAVRKEKDILTFDKIKTERERERLREREREMRMRRREEAERVKEIERRQRSEEARLERERLKIKEERDRLERERAELLELERERQKREREKIELERLELQRAKMRIQEEERRAVKRPAPTAFRERERSYEERKRPVAEGRHFADAPPPPRFDGPTSIKPRDPSPQMKKFTGNSSSNKDYSKRLTYEKRETYPPKRDYDERTPHSSAMSRSSGGGAPVPKYESSTSSSYPRDRDMRTGSDPRGGNVRNTGSNSMGSSSVPSSKYNSSDSKVRYSERERERSPHFSSRSVRDDRDRRVSDSTKSSDIRSSRGDHRYPEPKESVRYDRTSSSSTNWSQHKNFTPSNSSSSKPWNKDAWRSSDSAPSSGDRWNSNASSSRPSIPFSSNPSMSLGPSCPPPPGINTYVNDRFDYKSNMSNMRKY